MVEQIDPFSPKHFSAPKGNMIFKEFWENEETLWFSIFPFQNENDNQTYLTDFFQGLHKELSIIHRPY